MIQDSGWRRGPARMARAYSLDLRKRVVAAVASGQTCRTVAERFGVSVASVVKWSQRYRATGSAAAKPIGGRRPYALEGERHWVLMRVSQAPDLTLRALGRGTCSAWDHGQPLCGLALPAAGRHHVQKKACAPASRIGPTSPAGAHNGSVTKAGLIQDVWSSSM